MNRKYSAMLQTTGILLTALTACATASYAQGTWDELVNGLGDAGDLVATAQHTVGTGPLTTITGTLTNQGLPDDDLVDMYCITITDPINFRATLSSSPGQTQYNPLFLFYPNSNGITSQEGFYAGTPSAIGILVHPPVAGTYYLAIGTHDNYALNPVRQGIWTVANPETPPNGPGAPGPLDSWFRGGGGPGGDGPYTITLAGASYCEVPEPASLLFSALGGALLLLRGRNRR